MDSRMADLLQQGLDRSSLAYMGPGWLHVAQPVLISIGSCAAHGKQS